MTTIFSLDEWTEIADRGTSGDQVADILASWKEDRRWLLGELERVNKEHGEWQTMIEYRLEQAEIRVQRAEVTSAEVERLREALEVILNQIDYTAGNCRQNEMIGALITKQEFQIARRALARQSELAGEFTGKIETVKLYPGKALTPEETSNDYEEARTAARMAYYELTEKLDGEE